MSISGLSKVWSCATLQDGMNHVAHASSDRGEDAILRELQDGCRDASRLPPPTSRVGRSCRTSWLWMRPGLATPGCSRVVRLRVEAPLQAEALCPPAPDAATIPATTSAIVDLTYNSVLPHPPQTSTYLPGLGYELPAYGAGV